MLLLYTLVSYYKYSNHFNRTGEEIMKKWLKRSVVAAACVSALSISTVSAATLSPAGANSKQFISNSSLYQNSESEKEKFSALSEDTLVVKFNKPLTQAEHRAAGATLLKQFSNLNYAIVKVRDKKNFSKILNNYSNMKNVISVYPSVSYKQLALADPKANLQYQNSMLQLEKAQQLAGKNAVTVAVIDTGIDTGHPDLKGKLLPSYNTVNPMNPGSAADHGTHVAGIIAANKNNGIGGYGVNPSAKILPIDVFDRALGATDYAIADGIMQAINKGAKVINMSLGGPMESPLIEEAIKKALEKKIIIVAAAGNEGSNFLSYPAAYEGVISVGSVNNKKKLSSFSNYGTSVDMVAPGEEIYSSVYDYEKKSTFMFGSGTSMASPVVAGTASLLLSKHPNLTPIQVEYILEHTAEDLGEKGFDVKYANGLVNPVAALQYDVKKLPSFTKIEWTEKQIADKANVIALDGKQELTGSITAPFQEHWYKSGVKKGDRIQFVLNGSEQFDYKLMLYLISKDGKEKLEINSVREGVPEGKLYEVPFDGTLAYGVRDVNGSFDDSSKQQSKFRLSVEKAPGFVKDENSIKNIKSINLPFAYDQELLASADGKADDDFYQFSVEEEQVIKVNLSALPGVNSSISVYMLDAEQGIEEESLEGAEGIAADLEEMFYGDAPIEPIYYANKGGKSVGESLTFFASPGVSYLIKVSNNSDQYFGIFDYFMNYGFFEEQQEPESSLTPYKLEVQGKVMPADEDIFPVYFEEDVQQEVEISQLEKQRKYFESLEEEGSVEEAEFGEYKFIKTLEESAQLYTIGGNAQGFLQSLDDEDWFTVTPAETGIYKFDFSGKEVPSAEVYRVKKETDEQGKSFTYLEQIASNLFFDWYTVETKASLLTGLRSGEQYFIKINANYIDGSISFDPYKFYSQLVVKNPEDRYEDNDSLENIKNLPAAKFEANFAMPYDQDIFYFESKSSEVYGLSLNRKQMSDQWLARYPEELTHNFGAYAIIFEDTNKNRKLDPEEYNGMRYIERYNNGYTFGSFKTEKNKNYIIAIVGSFEGALAASLIPYEFSMAPVKQDDEDKGSVVKNNIPSKPIALKAAAGNSLIATGHLNAGVANGDEDWYELKLTKNQKGKIELNTGKEIDGVITIYKNGQKVVEADHYLAGDNEVLYFNLTKGVYHIKVNDSLKGASLNPYQVKVSFQ